MSESEVPDNLLIDDPASDTVRIVSPAEFRELAKRAGWREESVELYLRPPHLEFTINQERVIIHDAPRFVTPLRKGISV